MELDECAGQAATMLRQQIAHRREWDGVVEALVIEVEELRRKVALQDDQLAALKARMHRAELVTSMHTPMR